MSLQSIAQRVMAAGNRVFQQEWQTDQSQKAWLRRHSKRYANELRKLERSVLQSAANRRSLQQRVLVSASGRICNLVVAAAKRSKTLSRSEVEFIAGGLRPWRDCGEPVEVHKVAKSDGTFRATAMLGVRRLALSYLCRDVLSAVWPLHTDDYSERGRGVEAAIGCLMTAMENDRPWAFVADVKDCYPSIRHDGLATWLPLPEKVVRHSILIGEDVPIFFPNGMEVPVSLRDSLRQGLPQGSPASSVVVRQLLQVAVGPIAHQAFCAFYSDNLFGASEAEGMAVATLDALTTCLLAHPVGELTLHHASVRHLDEGVSLLGYKVRSTGNQEVWQARAYPSPASFARLQTRLEAELALVPSEDVDDRCIEKTAAWISSKKLWDPSAARMDMVHDQMLKVAAKVKGEPKSGEFPSI